MRSYFNKTILIISILAYFIPLPAQKLQYKLSEDKAQVSLLIDQRNTKLTVADILMQKKGRPLPESKIYSLDINMDTVGIWNKISQNEKIWKLSIRAPHSKGFFLSFDEFHLPPGGKLYVYNENELKESIIYSHHDNPHGGAYSIENLTGDNVILEYLAPPDNNESPKIHIARLGYKYTDDEDKELTGFNSAGNSCMINVNCPEGELWEKQKKGVVQLRMTKSDGETYLCSGSLVNNAKNDKTPYVLTSYHCFENMTEEEIGENTEFFFEYESPECEQNRLPRYKYHKGSDVLVLNPVHNGSDGALLQLSEPIPEDWDVYFNGWDRENRNSNIRNGVVIHHPSGDVKKISFFEKAPTSGKWSDFASKETHWLTNYSLGATRGGSSGSPMFNQNGLIVGTLTGGNNSCSNNSLLDYYGKFWYHWNQYPDNNMHMNRYLDPDNTDIPRLEGLLNNENQEQELLLEKYSLNMLIKSTATIRIINGNGEYTVLSEDENIATARLSQNIITVKANELGTTDIIVKDKKEKTKTINVSVHKDIDFSINENNEFVINVYKANDAIRDINVFNLDGDNLYKLRDLNEKSHSINLTRLRRGFYIVQVRTQQGASKTEKIIW